MWRALLIFLLFVFLARAVWRLLEGVVQGAFGDTSTKPRRPAGPPPVHMSPCPGCGTYVVPGKAISDVRRGQTVYFCSEACKNRGTGAGNRESGVGSR